MYNFLYRCSFCGRLLPKSLFWLLSPSSCVCYDCIDGNSFDDFPISSYHFSGDVEMGFRENV